MPYSRFALTHLYKSIALLSCLIVFSNNVFPQVKASITEGPVTAFTKLEQSPRYAFKDGRLYTKEQVYLEKGDWLVAHAQSREERVYVLLFDPRNAKYLRVADDSLYQSPYWRATLTYTIPRNDTFMIMVAAEVERGDEDDYFSSTKIDTPKVDYTIAAYRPTANNTILQWDFRQRLSYLCNHWTAGFRAMPRQANEEQKKAGKPVTEYFPEIPVTVLDSMGASIQVLSYGKTLVYFQFTADMPYSKAKELYDKLFAQLKAVSDNAEIRSLKDGRRINELATAYFSLKVPVNKVPVDYFFLDDAGKGYKYLPLNLFLFGTSKEAKVLLVMGERGSDIYDIGW